MAEALDDPLDLAALLNPEQLRAATHTDGPLLILAGAGSGKTRVLVHRVAHLLETRRARPYQIFCVTFTNKAAGEMRERLEKLLGPEVRDAWIGTFHGLCARILRLEGHRLGFTPHFTIYDADDARRLVKGIMADMRIDTSDERQLLSGILHEIDRAKNAGVSPKQFAEQAGRFEVPAQKLARAVYPKYQAALRRSNAMDFGDLLLLAVELLKHHPEARDRFQRRFRYVMVDEFQDTNKVQFDLLKTLVSGHRNLAVVGDDDQAIYRWRGADVSNILGFSDHYPGAAVVKLERNYRSTANILRAANSVIRKNTRRHDKTLTTDAEAGPPVRLALLGQSDDEAELVARTLRQRLDAGASPEDFAILYRQNAQSRLFEGSLRRERVPFVIIGGTGFYERMEVKDILAYLRLTANPTSRPDFERVVGITKGIGEKTLAKLREAGAPLDREGAELLEVDDAALNAAGIAGKTLTRVRELGRLLSGLRTLAESAPASEVARAIVERTKYFDHLEASDPASAEDRQANVAELVSSVAELEEELKATAEGWTGEASEEEEHGPLLGLAGAATPLQAFLDHAALVSPDDADSGAGRVSLLTVHSAKGLEFPVVFMVGMEERTFPSKRAIEEGDEDTMEEERRLCYVGMTRAMQELFLTAARVRRIYGKEEVRYASRFLGELPDQVVASFQGPSGRAPRPGEVVPTGYGTPLRRPAPPPARAVARGGDRIEYDDEPARHGPHAGPAHNPAPGPTGGFSPGAPVHHNTFGAGRVERVDGEGPNARLTIRFAGGVVKQVVARFVTLGASR